MGREMGGVYAKCNTHLLHLLQDRKEVPSTNNIAVSPKDALFVLYTRVRRLVDNNANHDT